MGAAEFRLTGQFLPRLPRQRRRVSRLDTPIAQPCSRWSPPPCTWSLRAEWEENAGLLNLKDCKTETSHYIQLETGVFQLLQQRADMEGGGWGLIQQLLTAEWGGFVCGEESFRLFQLQKNVFPPNYIITWMSQEQLLNSNTKMCGK